MDLGGDDVTTKTVAPNANLNQSNDKPPVGNEATRNSTTKNGITIMITTTIESIGNEVTTIPSPVEVNSVIVGETATVSGSETTTTAGGINTVGSEITATANENSNCI